MGSACVVTRVERLVNVKRIFPSHLPPPLSQLFSFSATTTVISQAYHQHSTPWPATMSESGLLAPLSNRNKKITITTTTLRGTWVQTWVLGKYLSGDDHRYTQADAMDADTNSFTVAKFACHLDGDASVKGFIRVYRQIPNINTELDSPEEKRSQAAKKPQKHREFQALLDLRDSGVVPSLLAWEVGKQGDDGQVPGGYFIHFVWAKVPGKSLNSDVVWKVFDLEKRENIREQFRIAYQYVYENIDVSRAKFDMKQEDDSYRVAASPAAPRKDHLG